MGMGMKITELKTNADMTQGKLGKDIEIGVNTLSGYEVGSRGHDLKICAYLQIILMLLLIFYLVERIALEF